jgi:hypothetical protein
MKSAPTPSHLEVGPIWWYEIINEKRHGFTWPELVELGAPKMEEPMSDFNKKTFLK